MTVHKINNRTQYYDDAAPKGVWPFWGCFGPWFPAFVTLEGRKLKRIEGLQYPEIRAVYQSKDMALVVFVKRGGKYVIERNDTHPRSTVSGHRPRMRKGYSR